MNFQDRLIEVLIEAKAYRGDPKKRAMKRALAAQRATRTRPQKPRTVARMERGTASDIRVHRRETALAASPKIGPRQSRGSQSMPSSAKVASAQTKNQGGGFRSRDQGSTESAADRKADFERDKWRKQAPGDQ